MLGTAKEVYVATRKKNDFAFNAYVMRPIAAVLVAAIEKTPATPNQLTLVSLFVFLIAGPLLVAMPTHLGGVVAVAVLELSYCFDCADGMLARFKKLASKEGHLFDFFTDELKATILVSFLAVRLYRTGGLGLDGTMWPAGASGFLVAGIAGVAIVSSGTSLTNFVRRPELSGRETTVEAYYESVGAAKARSPVGRVVDLVMALLRLLNHYPSHIWIFAIVGRLDLLFWMYVALNLLYLGRGWLGLVVRFGRPPRPS